jgi:hypothetical protein
VPKTSSLTPHAASTFGDQRIHLGTRRPRKVGRSGLLKNGKRISQSDSFLDIAFQVTGQKSGYVGVATADRINGLDLITPICV